MPHWDIANLSQPPAIPKQVVLVVKVAVLVYQSQPLAKPKQLVLVPQVADFHPRSPILSTSFCPPSFHQIALFLSPSLLS